MNCHQLNLCLRQKRVLQPRGNRDTHACTEFIGIACPNQPSYATQHEGSFSLSRMSMRINSTPSSYFDSHETKRAYWMVYPTLQIFNVDLGKQRMGLPINGLRIKKDRIIYLPHEPTTAWTSRSVIFPPGPVSLIDLWSTPSSSAILRERSEAIGPEVAMEFEAGMPVEVLYHRVS